MELKFDNKKLHKRMGIPLLIWASINIIAGSFYLLSSDGFVIGVLTMTLIWGIVNGVIGLISLLGKKVFVLEKIKKVILVNVYLDIGYAVVGLFLVFLGSIAIVIGSGYAVIIQGVFLFILDSLHHRHIKKLMTL